MSWEHQASRWITKPLTGISPETDVRLMSYVKPHILPLSACVVSLLYSLLMHCQVRVTQCQSSVTLPACFKFNRAIELTINEPLLLKKAGLDVTHVQSHPLAVAVATRSQSAHQLRCVHATDWIINSWVTYLQRSLQHVGNSMRRRRDSTHSVSRPSSQSHATA